MEISSYLDGDIELTQAVELMKMNTRRFAKRQLTWFRADKCIRWFDIGRLGGKAIAGRIARQAG
jgi:tRNA dimethylallyltransferase